MEFYAFHLMPYTDPAAMAALDRELEHGNGSAWVTFSNRHFDPAKGQEFYRRYLDELTFADQMGFDGVGVNEHHQTTYGMMPSPNIMAAALTQRVENGRIAILGNALPLHQPQHIAEQVAMLDLMSGGRVISGFVRGIGFEYVSHGINPAESRDRFTEAHDLIRKIWTEPGPFSWHGHFYDFDYVNVWPRPLQQPHPPIWIPSQGSAETVQWCAENGYPYLQTLTSLNRLVQIMQEYRKAAANTGYTAAPSQQGWSVPVYVGETEESAREEFAPHIEAFHNKLLTGPLPHFFPAGYLSEQSHLRVLASKSGLVGGTTTLADLEKGGMAICGTAESVVDRLRAAIDATGVGIITITVQQGTMPHEMVMRNIERLGKHVLPKLRDHVSAIYG